ncbi:ROK family transcriptional regulator [Nonomuraea sp. KC401]|uniref:ROK family transcriptional regulator n=1 Tax=unclassified Nonomuraea TaxID=2593643 RepID=UPI0010FEAF5D|nr:MULTISPECIES: ROK family transcriptional regulator [unclassified Nonomuraea]NBE96807.1 ROK family protein [Nonomuraea sp. K271]TLF68008.1 ROK family transcriptional regulator [Nonomuraea sp. KC401]
MRPDLPASSRAIAIDVLVHGAQSRAQLAKKTGLSAPTLTRLVRPLLDAGVLVESESVRTTGRGRSSVLLDVVADDHRYVGVKLTRESIYAVLTNLRAEVLASEMLPEPSLDVPDVVSCVAGVVSRMEDRAGRPVRGVGVTVGGRVDKGETVADSPFLDWHEVPFRTLLAEQVDAPLFLANDVVGLTMAQQWFGYGRTYPDFALLTVGAGVGYGLVINHELVPTLVSPIGHLPVDPHGPLCPAGHRGCMTALVTSGAMANTVSLAHGRLTTYDEVLELAEAGDPAAARVVAEAAHAVGRATAAITSLTGVDRIILSGEGVRLVEIAPDSLRAGRVEYADEQVSVLDPVIRPMDFLEWARGAAVVAIKASFP